MFKDYVGQQKVIRELQAIVYGIQYKQASVNILLRGPAGSGKTMLAKKFCKKIDKNYLYHIAEKEFSTKGLGHIRCHIVDEVHMLKNFETLYEYMDCGRYVFVFCTTEIGDLPDPFSSRCIELILVDYSKEDLAKIAVKYAQELGLNLSMDTALLIVNRSKGSPRKVKIFTRRIKFLLDKGFYPLTIHGVRHAFVDIGIYENGYTDIDRNYLKFLSEVDSASLSMISRSIKTDENTLKNEIEPFLIEKGHITISSRGRKFLDWKGLK
jgi:Holliday junction resolvasome RuvABC ATP-dependent DNA helicase subunit